MPIDYILISQNGQEGPRELRSAIEALRDARRAIEKIQGWMVHSQDGDDWSQLAARFSVPEGQAATLFTLIDGTLQALNGTTSGYADELLERVM